MSALKNPKHERFVQELISGKSQRQAYLAAFPKAQKWRDNTVDSRASELFHASEVLGRYQELQDEAKDKAVINRRERMMILTTIAKDDEEKTDTRIKAIDTLNKMDGEYVTKVEMSRSIDDTINEMEEYFEQANTDTPHAEN